MHTILNWIKSEIVLTVSFLLALGSSLVIRPDAEYLSYIDFRTLSILLTLMLIMAGFQRLSVFRQTGEMLVERAHTARGVAAVLIFTCFFSAMLITNDVALLTFVPFSIVTLNISGRRDLYITVIVLETAAANLGSMLTPLGNPQNLYLYSLWGTDPWSFISLMLPYTLLSLAALGLAIPALVKNTPVSLTEHERYRRSSRDRFRIAMHLVLFIVALSVVAGAMPHYAGLIITLLAVLVFDRRILTDPDYTLLLTFVFLFIFIGNMKRIPELSGFLSELMASYEVPAAILLSQVISNVPAAILCSGFTGDIPALVIGVNLGGLGTLIASMASLISFRQYSHVAEPRPGRYLLIFTLTNLILLALLYSLYLVAGTAFDQ
ncbi:MAG: citrate transporter [Clostridia bacterium]|nr:citrate transporter [Clostridia bacterium]